jgi:large subunit ribosomal protein L17
MPLGRLGRGAKHRKATLRNLVTSLLKFERIETTVARAKSLRVVADRMITLGKRGDKRSFVKASGYIYEKAPTVKLFTIMADRYKFRPGGYTRIMRTRRRFGDNAPMAYVEFVDREGELKKPTPVDADTFAEHVRKEDIYKSEQIRV